jgi:hypothetical protein
MGAMDEGEDEGNNNAEDKDQGDEVNISRASQTSFFG